VLRGKQETEVLRPRPVERSQALEYEVSVAFKPPADQLGEGSGRQAVGGWR
jgi:hypothetical protein